MPDALFTAGEFAEIARTTIATLHHYDRIGLFSPEVRGENKYRYYSIRQLALINMITTMQKLGVPLAEIAEFKDRRSPELCRAVLIQQLEHIWRQIDVWRQSEKLLSTLLQIVQSGLDVSENIVTTQFLPEKPIVLGEANDYKGGKNDYDALHSFYRAMHNKYSGASLDYPAWGIFSKERILNGDCAYPDRFYFYNPDGADRRPAALYAIGHMRTGYGQGAPLYRRMVEHIDQNGLEICGDAYEEYPLNELCVAEDKDYLLRVLITVREKTT